MQSDGKLTEEQSDRFIDFTVENWDAMPLWYRLRVAFWNTVIRGLRRLKRKLDEKGPGR